MRKVFRNADNSEYWEQRWAKTGRDAKQFLNLTIYPIRYAEMVVQDRNDRIVELGAGLGRVLKHYHYNGYTIAGLERSPVAVNQLRAEDSALRIEQGDVRDLPFHDAEFDVVLAFGLFHNLEEGMDNGLAETARCLKRGGRFCISMRPNNIEMTLNEWYWRWKQRHANRGKRAFHKWLVGEDEFRSSLESVGLRTARIARARNVSILYRLPWLRARPTEESDHRARGYRLNSLGKIIDRGLVRLFPAQFCNVLVYIGTKI